MIDSIVVNPTFEMNRDEIEKQVGHKLVINFMQPIVDDGIEYLTDVKSDGYNEVNGKKNLILEKLIYKKVVVVTPLKKTFGIDTVVKK